MSQNKIFLLKLNRLSVSKLERKKLCVVLAHKAEFYHKAINVLLKMGLRT